MKNDILCNCLTKTPDPKYHSHRCPMRKGIKFPRLFYWEDAENSYCPAPDLIEEIINIEDSMDENGEEIEITFKRFDMTDEEYDNLPVN